MDTTVQNLAIAEHAAPISGWFTADSVGTLLMALATIAVAIATVFTYRVARISAERRNKERAQNLKRERTEKLVDLTNFMLQNRELFNNAKYPIYNIDHRYETIIRFNFGSHRERRTKKVCRYNFIIVREKENRKNVLSFSYMGDHKVEPMSIEIDREPDLELEAKEWEVLFDALKNSINRALIGSRNYLPPMLPYYDMESIDIRNVTGLSGIVTGHVGMNSKFDKKLIEAILGVNVNSVKKLAKKVTHIDARDTEGRTFLHYAVKDAHNQIIGNKSSPFIRTIIHRRISKSYTLKLRKDLNSIISILVKEEADVNAQDNRGTPILYSAASSNNPQAIDILASAGANVNARSKHNFGTAIHIASHYGWDGVIDRLIEHGANIDRNDREGDTPLHKASAQGWPSTVSKLIDHGLRIDDKNRYGETPLHKASIDGGHRAIEQLMERGAKRIINDKDESGETPLHRASLFGSYREIEILMKYGADMNLKNKNGESPLHKAAVSGQPRNVKSLINANIDIDKKDIFGETALHKAAASDSRRTIEALVECGANVSEKNQMDETPLHVVIYNFSLRHISFSEIVEKFIECGADVCHKDINGSSPHDLILRRIYLKGKRR